MDDVNSAQWAASPANKFRPFARDPENPTTKVLAEWVRQLAEAVRDLGAR